MKKTLLFSFLLLLWTVSALNHDKQPTVDDSVEEINLDALLNHGDETPAPSGEPATSHQSEPVALPPSSPSQQADDDASNKHSAEDPKDEKQAAVFYLDPWDYIDDIFGGFDKWARDIWDDDFAFPSLFGRRRHRSPLFRLGRVVRCDPTRRLKRQVAALEERLAAVQERLAALRDRESELADFVAATAPAPAPDAEPKEGDKPAPRWPRVVAWAEKQLAACQACLSAEMQTRARLETDLARTRLALAAALPAAAPEQPKAQPSEPAADTPVEPAHPSPSSHEPAPEVPTRADDAPLDEPQITIEPVHLGEESR